MWVAISRGTNAVPVVRCKGAGDKITYDSNTGRGKEAAGIALAVMIVRYTDSIYSF